MSEAVIEACGRAVSAGPVIRRATEPGDLGEVIALHGRLYVSGYGMDQSMAKQASNSPGSVPVRQWGIETDDMRFDMRF